MAGSVVRLGFALLLGSAVPAWAAEQGVTVVELFTSQGCSSCPPADAFLGELSKRPDVLALSEHVDYWDYLGWHDPFGSRDASQRQRAFTRRLGLSYVYTPQMVVDGSWQASGADRGTVLRLISDAQATPRIPMSLERSADGNLSLRLPQTTLPSPADVWLLRIDPRQLTSVARGENSGRQIENYNIVRSFTHLAKWSGEPVSVAVPTDTGQNYAFLVQQRDGGTILGAARIQTPAP